MAPRIRPTVDRILADMGTTSAIFIADHLDAGWSYEDIAAGFQDFTDGKVQVHSATIRRWAKDDDA